MKVSFIQSDKSLEKSTTVCRLNEYRRTVAELIRTWTLSEIKEIDDTVSKSLALERSLRKEDNDSSNQGIERS